MRELWTVTIGIVVSIVLVAVIFCLANMKGKKGIDEDGNIFQRELGKKARKLRKIGISVTAVLLIISMGTTSILASGGLSNFASFFVSAKEDDGAGNSSSSGVLSNLADILKAAAMDAVTNLQEETQGRTEDDIEDVVHPGLDLSQEELDVLTAGIEFYVGRQSMTSWLPIRNELCGFQNAVSIPLDLMFLDYDYVEELHGRSKTNPSLKALPTADVLKAISEKLEEWEKLYADLPEDERNQAMEDAIKQEIAINIIFADSVVQFMCTQKYYTQNNEWLWEGKDMLDQIYQEPNGIWSICEYVEGYTEDSDCASAHLVYRNDIMERKINSAKDAEKRQTEATNNDGDDTVNGDAEDDETEYYSFGYVTLVQRLIALIDETTTVGICKGMTTTQNWYLVETANPSFTRTTLSPYQESGDVFLLQVVDKSGHIVLRYGFNMKDRRVCAYDRTDKPVEVVHNPNLTARYLEEGTDKQLANPKTEYRAPGTSLDDVKPISITDYTCINPNEAQGKTMPDGNLVITFYYRKTQTTKTPTYLLTVVCKDEASGQQFDSFSLGSHKEGEKVTIPHNDYDGREFVSGPSVHPMPASDDTVTLTYRQKPAGGDPDPDTPDNPEPSPEPSTPPPDGEGAKVPAADPENKPENDYGRGDNDDPGEGSNKADSSEESKKDVDNSKEQEKFDAQEKEDQEEAASQGKGDSSGTGGEDHKVINPNVPEENQQGVNPADKTPTNPKKEETTVDEKETTDENGNTTKEEQKSDASDKVNSGTVGEPLD